MVIFQVLIDGTTSATVELTLIGQVFRHQANASNSTFNTEAVVHRRVAIVATNLNEWHPSVKIANPLYVKRRVFGCVILAASVRLVASCCIHAVSLVVNKLNSQ